MGRWAWERKKRQPRGSACISRCSSTKLSNRVVIETESASRWSGCTNISTTRNSVRWIGAAISDCGTQILQSRALSSCIPTNVALGFSQIGLETVMVVYLVVDEAKVVFFGVFIFAHDDPMMLDSLLDMPIDYPISLVASSLRMFVVNPW